MATDLPVELVRHQDWLEPIADRVQPAIAAALDDPIGTKVANICMELGWDIRSRGTDRCAARLLDSRCGLRHA